MTQHLKAAWMLVALALIALVLPTSLAAQPYALRYNLEPGQVFITHTTVKQTTKQSMMGQETTIGQNSAFEIKMEVTEKTATGSYVIKATYSRIVLDIANPMMPIKYDSANPPAAGATPDPLSQVFGAIVGKSFTLTIKPTGQIESITGIDEILTGTLNAIPGMDAAVKQQILEMQKEMLGAETLKGSLGQGLPVYPEKPVSVGDTWSNSLETSGGFGMKFDTRYTLVSATDAGYEIKVESSILKSPTAKPLQMGPMSFNFTMDGAMTGTGTVDKTTGMPLQTSGNQDIDMMIEVPMGGPDAPPQKMPMKITGTISMKTAKQ